MAPPASSAARAPGRRASTARRRLRALVWRSRLVLLALGCGLVAAVVVDRLSPPPPDTRPVVVTARAVGAGTVLTEGDVTVVPVAARLAPESSLTTVSDAVGRTTAVALPAGQVLSPSLVAAGDLAAMAPGGTVVAPVRLSDPDVAALLHPGDRVDLLAATGSAGDAVTGSHLARRALVVAGAPASASSGGLLGDGTQEGGVTLVAVLPEEAAALAGVGEWGGLSVVLVP
ncbi:SAF domain-containing protein [Oerskovia rustica]|uniref:Flagella basal body P-ring formation protein FlgA n=1 Tax=Oerskovia rustica TaxID=2762237 RepID=A0ABR8RP50_9CELL|nr:SAF domain-containing protein [Oerskovia rustica]MBD7949569.1 flagella basal body P-ring formation protein FlgA [Oerskovia rustica]